MQIVPLGEVPQHLDVVASWHFAEWPRECSVFGLETVSDVRKDLEKYLAPREQPRLPMTLVALSDDGTACGTVTLDNEDMIGRSEGA